MTGFKGAITTKLIVGYCKTMKNIQYIRNWLALACADTGDNFKFILDFEENLFEL